jgi:hypothetical protein
VPPGPRLRQVALVAADGERVAGALRETFGWGTAFRDRGVGQFGLANSVFAVGDTFVEVVAPLGPGTTAGRYLERRGGDSGYMAIFQVPDLAAARRRVAALGVRVVWSADLGDVAGTHLHPKDVPGALVSIDWADPPESWRWAGPAWTGKAPPHGAGGIVGLTIEVDDPASAAARWAGVLGLAAGSDGAGATVFLADAGQHLRFEPAAAGRGEGIVEVRLSGMPVPSGVEIAGVRFVGC